VSARWHALLTTVCGLALAANLVFGWPWAGYVAVAAGAPFALGAASRSIRGRAVDVNVLMVLAGAGAVALGHVPEAAVLLFLFSLASTLEEYAMARTQSAIEGLVRLRPQAARKVEDGAESEVRVEDLRRGDLVRILPFEGVPVDAEVVSGSSSVDRSSMSGESQPVPAQAGDTVLAGTQNLEGTLLARVVAEAGATALDRIVELVRQAQESKGSGERVSLWFGQRYTFFVLGAFLVSFLVRYMTGQAVSPALYGALGLLVALSPCALVISTPSATLSALSWAARRGMLVRGGAVIESAGKVDVVALDKTGTLTEGRPRLVELCCCGAVPVAAGRHDGMGDACWHGGPEMNPAARDVLAVAAAVESHSTHPIADAIVAAAREQGCAIPEAAEVSVAPGLGVEAEVRGRRVRIGQPRFFPDLRQEFVDLADGMRSQGMTVAILSVDGEFAALGLRDRVRPEAGQAVAGLRAMGVRRIALLTGDSEPTARAVAREAGIEEYAAGLMPEDKEAWVRKASEGGATVLFVGDGINDAPVLTRSPVGVAMGGLGSDIAMNAANVVLMNDDLRQVEALVRLGRKSNRIIRGNLVFAAGIIVGLAAMTFVLEAVWPEGRSLILPLAVVGHEGSTAIVVLNGLRLLRGP
jgi:Cd2+/Zn2+-exporting ATPase